MSFIIVQVLEHEVRGEQVAFLVEIRRLPSFEIDVEVVWPEALVGYEHLVAEYKEWFIVTSLEYIFAPPEEDPLEEAFAHLRL